MKSIRLLFAFADAGNVDPVTPAFDSRLAVEEVVLIHSPGEELRARWLARLVQADELRVRLVGVPGLSHFDQLRVQLLSLFKRHPHAAVNISGTDAARAVLAAEAARLAGLPVCVVEPDTDRLHWIHAPSHFQGFDVADRITLDGFMAAHGFSVKSAEAELGDVPDPLDQLSRDFAELAFNGRQEFSKFCGALHFDGYTTTKPATGALLTLAKTLEAEGCLEITKTKRLHVPEAAYRVFISGGWLERWLFRTVVELAGPSGLQDAARGLKIVSDLGVENEFDVALLRGNALFVAECKGLTAHGALGNDLMFKLHSLSEQRELNACALLLCTQPPSDKERQRSRNLDLLLIGGSKMSTIKGRLAEWLVLGQ